MKRKRKPHRIEPITAMHIVATAIDAERKRGTPEYDEAVKIKDEIVRLWREQIWNPRKCPKCGQSI